MDTTGILEWLRIKNSFSHKDTLLKFHKGVNVIVGEASDAGKSAILKCIRILYENKPGGTDWISDWSKTAIIRGKVDGDIVKRFKKYTISKTGRRSVIKSNNRYYLNKRKFTGFGQGVPKPISDLFNVIDVNIQQQLDHPFLMKESSGEVARYFNRIVNLDDIDRTTKNINSKRKEEEAQLKKLNKEKKRLNKSVKEFKWVIEASDEIKRLETLRRSIEATSKQIYEIESLIEDIEDLKTDMEVLSKLVKAEPSIIHLMKLEKGIRKDAKEYNEISTLVKDIDRITLRMKKKNKEKTKLEKLLKKLMPDICPLCGK